MFQKLFFNIFCSALMVGEGCFLILLAQSGGKIKKNKIIIIIKKNNVGVCMHGVFIKCSLGDQHSPWR